MYVCMYGCMHACMHVCLYVCMHACMYVCMYACMYVCMHVCMHACMYVCMYVCMHVWMFVCLHACMYVCMYVCIYIYIHESLLLGWWPSPTWVISHQYWRTLVGPESQRLECWSPPFISKYGSREQHGNISITLWLFNIAMENGPFIDGLPSKNGDFPWLC